MHLYPDVDAFLEGDWSVLSKLPTWAQVYGVAVENCFAARLRLRPHHNLSSVVSSWINAPCWASVKKALGTTPCSSQGWHGIDCIISFSCVFYEEMPEICWSSSYALG